MCPIDHGFSVCTNLVLVSPESACFPHQCNRCLCFTNMYRLGVFLCFTNMYRFGVGVSRVTLLSSQMYPLPLLYQHVQTWCWCLQSQPAFVTNVTYPWLPIIPTCTDLVSVQSPRDNLLFFGSSPLAQPPPAAPFGYMNSRCWCTLYGNRLGISPEQNLCVSVSCFVWNL